jgi:hypothetical protein
MRAARPDATIFSEKSSSKDFMRIMYNTLDKGVFQCIFKSHASFNRTTTETMVRIDWL